MKWLFKIAYYISWFFYKLYRFFRWLFLSIIYWFSFIIWFIKKEFRRPGWFRYLGSTVIIGLFSVYYFWGTIEAKFLNSKNTASTSSQSTAALNSLPSQNKDSSSTPNKIKISSIAVDAKVIALGLDSKNRIDVPKNLNEVSWYSLGGFPGNTELKPAVFTGHYAGRSASETAVFDNLNKVSVGDIIEVSLVNGEVLKYKISSKIDYKLEDVPMAKIVTPDKQDRIEIITCGGDWLGATYSSRTVVTALRDKSLE
jgi:LPXTG-site transpeptidase (sortase) family protein